MLTETAWDGARMGHVTEHGIVATFIAPAQAETRHKAVFRIGVVQPDVKRRCFCVLGGGRLRATGRALRRNRPPSAASFAVFAPLQGFDVLEGAWHGPSARFRLDAVGVLLFAVKDIGRSCEAAPGCIAWFRGRGPS
jgi:hypothetical protein